MEVNGTIIVQIVVFLSLLFWLAPSLFAPLLKLFDERERRIEGAKIEASKLSELANEKSQSFDVAYEKARDNARHALSSLKQEMEKEHTDTIEKAKAIARERLSQAEQELLLEEATVRQQLQGSSAVIADDIVNALMRRSA